MENPNKTYSLQVEKLIHQSPAEVFKAISQGRLFTNCSADHESLKIEFKVGGTYFIRVVSHGMTNHGSFLEIIPNQRIVFTWCQDYEENAVPDTQVVIELKEASGKTALTLTHSGFRDQENCEMHQSGWTNGLGDMILEITEGNLSLTRQVSLPLAKAFETFNNPKTYSFGEIQGAPLESEPNKKLVFHWKPEGKVTLTFEDEDGKSCWIGVKHEGVKTESLQLKQRAGWDALLKRLI